jgi:hypothetical protein
MGGGLKMSCELFMYTERIIDGQWVNVDIWRASPFWTKDDSDGDEFYCEQVYRGQSYELFKILADVRNYDPDAIEPISVPRGLPPDLSAQVARKAAMWTGPEWHHHSWLTLTELQGYEWDRPIKRRTLLTAEEFKSLLDHGHPRSVGGAIPLSNPVLIAPNELTNMLPGALHDPNAPHYVTDVEWEEPAYQVVDNFVSDVIPWLNAIKAGDNLGSHGPQAPVSGKEVRIVFWFNG